MRYKLLSKKSKRYKEGDALFLCLHRGAYSLYLEGHMRYRSDHRPLFRDVFVDIRKAVGLIAMDGDGDRYGFNTHVIEDCKIVIIE